MPAYQPEESHRIPLDHGIIAMGTDGIQSVALGSREENRYGVGSPLINPIVRHGISDGIVKYKAYFGPTVLLVYG